MSCNTCRFAHIAHGDYMPATITCRRTPNFIKKQVTDWCGEYVQAALVVGVPIPARVQERELPSSALGYGTADIDWFS